MSKSLEIKGIRIRLNQIEISELVRQQWQELCSEWASSLNQEELDELLGDETEEIICLTEDRLVVAVSHPRVGGIALQVPNNHWRWRSKPLPSPN